MGKYLLLVLCSSLWMNAYSQLILVPDQPNQMSINKTIKANDNLTFIIYSPNNKIFAYDGFTFEEIVWSNSSPGQSVEYYGAIDNKHYFKYDEFLYEYDHSMKATQVISMPTDYPCKSSKLFANDTDNSIWFNCFDLGYDKAILTFDGTFFEAFDVPQNYKSNYFQFLYSSDLNQVLIWYSVNNATEKVLYHFDGNSLTQIPKPNTNYKLYWPGIVYDNQFIVAYEGYQNNQSGYSLFKFDGASLTQIPGLRNDYSQRGLMAKEDKLYLYASNHISNIYALYEYDGTEFTSILDETHNFFPIYLTENDGKNMFSLANSTYNPSLYSYDGVDFQEITGANDCVGLMYAGMLNDKIYLNYQDSNYQNNLYSFTAGDSQVEPLSNFPAGFTYADLVGEFDNVLLYRMKESPTEFRLFSYDETNQFLEIHPDNYTFKEFVFELNGKIYLSFLDKTTYETKLFVLDATLNTSNNNFISKMILYPNPVSDFLNIEIPGEETFQKFDVSLFSMDGKRVYNQPELTTDNSIKIDVNHIKSGIYVVELKSDKATIRTKFIKK